MRYRWGSGRSDLRNATSANALLLGEPFIKPRSLRLRRAGATAPKNQCKKRKRGTLEALEQRILLNADLTGDAGIALASGSSALRDWAQTLESHQAFVQAIPAINRALGPSIEFGAGVATYIADKIDDFMDPTSGEFQGHVLDGDSLAALLSGSFVDGFGTTTITLIHAGDDPIFDISLQRQSAPGLELDLDLSGDDGGLDATLSETGRLTTSLSSSLTFTMGVDATGFFVREASLAASIQANLTDFDATLALGDFVRFDAQVGASVDAAISLDATGTTWRIEDLQDLNATGQLSLSGNVEVGFTGNAGFGEVELFQITWSDTLLAALSVVE